MSNPINRLFQRQSLRTDIRRALDSGVGVYRTTWQLHSLNRTGTDETLSGNVIGWCRNALSQTRRPYGLDYVTLALASVDVDGTRIASASFPSLRPRDFYGRGRAESEIKEILHGWAQSHALPTRPGGCLSAVLFSWGDLTRDLLLAG